MQLVPQASFLRLVSEDFQTNRRRIGSSGFHALLVHRLGRAVKYNDKLLARLARPVYRCARALVESLYGIELPPEATVGRRLFLPHPHGIVLVPGCVIGDDCMIRHNVTIGAGSDTRGGFPTIGDRVQFGPGSIAMGAITIGDDVLVGPGAVVVADVPASSRVLAPAAVVRPPKDRWDRPEPESPTE